MFYGTQNREIKIYDSPPCIETSAVLRVEESGGHISRGIAGRANHTSVHTSVHYKTSTSQLRYMH